MMPFKLVVLWTDVLVYALIITAALLVWAIRRHEHLRAPWRQVAKRRLGMASAVILVVFVSIGLLDSVHFRMAQAQNGHQYYSTNVSSLLDVALSPLDQQYERTYSAPFALHSFAKSIVTQPDGTEVRGYAKLQHAGQHLASPNDRAADIVSKTAVAALQAIGIWLLLVIALSWMQAKRQALGLFRALTTLFVSGGRIAWRDMLYTTLVLLIVIMSLLKLSHYYHVFGTDKVGKDIFFEAVKSIRTGLVIGTITTLVMLPFAIILGASAGYFRGWVDDLIQYIYTTLSSVPGVLLISAAILSLQVFISTHPDSFPTLAERADARLLALCLILGVTSWTSLCRLLRAETLKVREMDYVRASIAMGVNKMKVLSRHIIPNIMHIVLITVVLDFSALVLAEAVLSYVGVGVDPTTMSWGNMINSARLDLAREPVVWWPLMAAFCFMFLLVLAANLFADAVRDAFDPKLRELA